MEVSRIRALRGPNLWSRHTAIEAIVACDEVERAISTRMSSLALRENQPGKHNAATRSATTR